MAGKKWTGIGKYILAVLLAVTVATAPNLPYITQASAAGDISDSEQTKESLEQKNEELTRQLEQARQNTEDQRAHKEALEQKIQVLQQQVQVNNQELQQLDQEIQELEAQIADKEKEIDEGMETLKLRLRAIYMAGEASTLDIILNSTDVSDFLDKVMIVKNVTAHDMDLIQTLQNSVSEIQTQRDAIDQKKEEATQTKQELDSQIAEISQLMEEDIRVIQELEGQEQSIQGDLDENNSQLQSIEEEIRQYYEQKRQEEEQRQQEEENSSQENPESSSNGNGSSGNESSNGNSSGNNSGSNSGGSGSNNIPVEEGQLVWPTPGFYYLSSYWGDGRNHGAIDIAGSNIYGANVVAADSGTVIAAYTGCTHDYPKDMSASCECGGGYGNYVMIAHDDGTIMTVYGHLSYVGVGVGQHVSRNQIIGHVGTTGRSTGPHLHYEVRVNGVKQDPMKWY